MKQHRVTVELRNEETRQATDDERWMGEEETLVEQEAGWYAFCEDCGWLGNNPYIYQDDAMEAAAYHGETGRIEDARSLAVDNYHEAELPQERARYAAAYLTAGRKRA